VTEEKAVHLSGSARLIAVPGVAKAWSIVELPRVAALLGVLWKRTRDPDLVKRAWDIRSLSLSKLGWATSHRTRYWEYAWVAEQVAANIGELTPRAVDVGAGRSPMPFVLSGLGLSTLAADPALASSDSGAWGMPDYDKFGIDILEAGMSDLRQPPQSCGVVICVSVIEHVPAVERRAGLAEMARVLAPGGICVLTVDVVPGTDDLWNRSMGSAVEADDLHGTVPDLIGEAGDHGLRLESLHPCPISGARPHVDVMGLLFRAK
jgi:SAM-dependent methyltransferase